MDILDPTPTPTRRRLPPVPRPSSLAGLRLGVVDNGKPNAGDLLEAVVDRLHHREHLGDVTTVRKPAIGQLAPDSMREFVVDRADVVITGVGDCSGCTTCTVQDAIDLEAAGCPTAVLVTDEFLPLARRHADRGGAGSMRFVVVEHPLGARSPAELDELGRACVDAVTAWLTGASVRTGGIARTTTERAAPAPDTTEGTVTCLC